MLSQYRALLARARARRLLLGCLLGWLAFTSYALAIILAVHAATGSFRAAGGAAAFSAGSGLLAPARGRFIDGHGARAVAGFALAHACAAAGLIAACGLHLSAVILVMISAVAGALAPPLIATARMLWADIAGPGLARPAHALNASLADVAQLVSPGLTGGLAALAGAGLALAVLVTAATVAGVIVAFLGDGLAPVRRQARRRLWGVLSESPGLRTLVACDVAAGLWSGALEVSLTALAARHGGAELAAIPLVAAALGGILASLSVGSRSGPPPAGTRYVSGALIVAVALPLMLVHPSLGAVTAIAVLAGAGYGILGAALFELLDHVVSTDRAVEAFTWLTTGQAAGTAAGAAIAGALTQRASAGGFILVALCGAAAALITVLRRDSLRMAA
jgi:MFS family permease